LQFANNKVKPSKAYSPDRHRVGFADYVASVPVSNVSGNFNINHTCPR